MSSSPNPIMRNGWEWMTWSQMLSSKNSTGKWDLFIELDAANMFQSKKKRIAVENI